MDGWIWMDGWVDGWMDGMDEWMAGWIDGWNGWNGWKDAKLPGHVWQFINIHYTNNDNTTIKGLS